jgi:hypothetical protein
MWQKYAFNQTFTGSDVRRLTLPKNTSAIQWLPATDAPGKLGALTQLPSGATVDICGDGFNERTAKVRYCEGYFFVFLQDLQEPACFAASA